MLKLIRASFIRYLSDSFIQLALILSPVLGCIAVLTSISGLYSVEIKPVWFAVVLMVCALLTSLAVGREFHDGTIRNKLIVGHSKPMIFLAELVAALVISVMTYILSVVPFYLATGEFRHEMPVNWQIRIYLLLLCVYLLFTALTVSLTFISSNRVIAVLGVFGILGLMFLLSSAQEELIEKSDPETRYFTEYICGEDGEFKEIQKERYDFLPLPKYTRNTIIWLNHCNTVSSLQHFTGYFNKYGRYRGHSSSDPELDKERKKAMKMIAEDFPPQIIVFILIPLAACLRFRKQDIQ